LGLQPDLTAAQADPFRDKHIFELEVVCPLS
jgi:hypothetical protein